MRKVALILLVILVIPSCKNKVQIESGIVIKNVTIISTSNNDEITTLKSNVLIVKDTIAAIDKNLSNFSIKNKTVIDGNEKYLIPGLIDSHVHLANLPGLNYKLRRKYPELAQRYYEQLPKSYLYYGFTTLIDVNNFTPSIITKINQSKVKPDIYTCGKQIQVMNDFMMEMEEIPLKTRYQLPFLNDKYNTNVVLPNSIDLSRHTPVKAIETNIERQNGICIKTLYEDETTGFKKFWENPTIKIMQELVYEAKKDDIPVLLHATSFEGQLFGLKSGVDIMAHSMWNWTSDPSKLEETNLPQTHKILLKQIAKKKIGYQPTFRTILAETDIIDKSLLEDIELLNSYPREYLNWLKTEEAQWIRKRILARPEFIKKVNPEFYNAARSKYSSDEKMMNTIIKALKTRINRVVSFLEKNNANLLFATDGVAMNMYTNPPGYNGYLEMNHWINAGLSLETIFKAATINNAKAFNLDNEVGSIDIGKKANLLVLNKNPLQDVSAYNAIKLVLINGNLFERSSLSAINN